MVRRGIVMSAVVIILTAAASASAGDVHYFAEGALGFFRTDIGLINPSTTDTAHVSLTYVTEDGQRVVQQVTLGPMQRQTVSVNEAMAGFGGGVSTIVESDRPIGADRFMEWGGSGYGSSLSGSVSAPAQNWYFAEGATSVFSLYYLLLNPGETPAQVTITYLQELGGPVTRTYTVDAHTRRTIVVNDDPALAYTSLAAVVSSDVPIVAERSMYLNSPGETFTAGAAGFGATQLSTSWMFAEGVPGGFFDEFLLIANPGTTATTATITYRRPDGVSATATYDVPAQTRTTVYVNQEIATNPALASIAGYPISATITATIPIVAERAMWWPRNVSGWYESSTTLGATRPAAAWVVAEGRVGGPRGEQTYILITNTASTPGSVRVTAVDDAGHAAAQTFPIAASGRLTIDVGETFALTDTHVSALVDSLGASPVPLVVEYSRYGNSDDGQIWSAGDTTLATPREIDSAPTVVSTSPINSATSVAFDANLSVTFSEPVNVTASAFTLECPNGTSIALTTPNNSPATTFTLHPATHLPFDAVCRLVVHATAVTDADFIDPPDTMASDVTVMFTVGPCPAITISPTTLADAMVGVPYPPVTFSQTGAPGTATFSIVGSLPDGLTFNQPTLSGTPTTPGMSTITVRVQDSAGCSASRTVNFHAVCQGNIIVMNPVGGVANAGVAFSQTFLQTGATTPTFSVNSGALPNGVMLSASGVLSGSPTQTGTFTITVKVTDASGCSGVGGAYTLTIKPVAHDDGYSETVLGNVPVDSGVIGYSVTASNDTIGTSTIGAYDAITVHGGSVSMTTSGPNMGRFTYNPPRGYTGSDSFTYTLTDGPLASATATVTLNVSGMAWFIDNHASCGASCDGRLQTPYASIAAFQSANTGLGVNNPKPGDAIFIYSHDSSSPYTGGLILQNNQGLFGQDGVAVAGSFAALTGLTVPASSLPAVPGVAPAGTLVDISAAGIIGVRLARDNTVRGLTVSHGFGGIGISGVGSFSTLTVSDVIVRGTGQALDLSYYVASAVFRSISSGSGSYGIKLDTVTGSFSVAGDGVTPGSGGQITGAVNNGVSLVNSANISLAFMNVQSNHRAGILAASVGNLTLDHVQSLDNGTSTGEAAFEGDRIYGTTNFTASIFKSAGESALYLHDSSGASTPLTFTATNCTFFNGTSSTSLTMGDAVDLFPSGTNNVSYTFTGSSFTGAYRDLLHLEPIGTSTTTITLTNNTFNGYGNAAMTGRGISIFNGTPLGSNNIALPFDGSIAYTIANNQITGTAGDAITVGILGLMSTVTGATASGTITGNTIGNPADPTFGATTGGIYIFNDGASLSGIRGTHSVRIENNLVQHARNGGLAVYAGPNGGTATNLKIYSNTFLDFDATSAMDIRVWSSGTMGDAEQLCLDFGSGAHPNTIVLPLFGTEDIYLWRQYDAMAFLPGYTGAPNDYLAVSQYVATLNNGSGGVTLGNPPGPGGFYNVGSCPTP